MRLLLNPSREQDLEHERVRRACAGDRAAFEELCRGHLPRIYRVLFRLTGNHEDAEDLCQECFVRAWRALDVYRAEAAFGAWLERIAVHLARDHHRARVRRGPAVTLSEEPPARQAGGAEVARRELQAQLLESLERLPERQRLAIVLRALEGRAYGDVASAVGVTPATARTLVMKARRRLMRALEPWLARRPR